MTLWAQINSDCTIDLPEAFILKKEIKSYAVSAQKNCGFGDVLFGRCPKKQHPDGPRTFS